MTRVRSRRRRTLLVLGSLVALLGVVLATRSLRAPARPRCERCNVLLVTFDALRADHLGAYGYAKPTSPRIDALAGRSVVFTRNLSQAASTIASIPSMQTSKFPHLDLLLEQGVLRPREVTLAELLAGAGYATAAVISNQYAGCRWGVCQGFDATDEQFRTPETAADTAARALAFLTAAGRRPFLLWVHFIQPHAPYVVPEEVFRRLYGGTTTGPTFHSPGVRALPLPTQLELLTRFYVRRGEPFTSVHFGGRQRARLTPTVERQLVAMYDGSITQGDEALGTLLDRLVTIGAADRTVVIVAADHAESLGEGGLIGHNRLWYRTLHTPLIVHVPGVGPRRSERPVMNVDILPTILEVVGLPHPERVRGRSVFAAAPHAVQYAEVSGAVTVLGGDFRLHVPRRSATPGATAMLFDVRTDPAERLDLAESRRDVVRKLLSLLAEVRAASLARDPSAPDTDVEQKLRDLGYIQ